MSASLTANVAFNIAFERDAPKAARPYFFYFWNSFRDEIAGEIVQF